MLLCSFLASCLASIGNCIFDSLITLMILGCCKCMKISSFLTCSHECSETEIFSNSYMMIDGIICPMIVSLYFTLTVPVILFIVLARRSMISFFRYWCTLLHHWIYEIGVEVSLFTLACCDWKTIAVLSTFMARVVLSHWILASGISNFKEYTSGEKTVLDCLLRDGSSLTLILKLFLHD